MSGGRAALARARGGNMEPRQATGRFQSGTLPTVAEAYTIVSRTVASNDEPKAGSKE